MKKLLMGLGLSLICASPIFAVKVSSLYRAEMPVASQTSEMRAEAVRQGFIQVLIKVSGDPSVEKNPTIRNSIARADYYVQEYSYGSPSTSASQYRLNVHFDKADVNRLLHQAGVPYWGENRPLILVWLAMTKSSDDAEIIGNDSPASLLENMKAEGKKYGLPLIFPMMDVTDINQVSVADIKDMTMPVLKTAGKRYAPDAYLVGSIEKNDENYVSQWQLVLGSNEWNWTITDAVLDNVVSSVLNQVSQTLAQHYVVKTAEAKEQWYKLEVVNVSQRSDLKRLIKYLHQLTPVAQAELSQVAGDVVEIALLLHGSLESFQKNAEIGQHLVLKSQETANNKLTYEWLH